MSEVTFFAFRDMLVSTPFRTDKRMAANVCAALRCQKPSSYFFFLQKRQGRLSFKELGGGYI